MIKFVIFNCSKGPSRAVLSQKYPFPIAYIMCQTVLQHESFLTRREEAQVSCPRRGRRKADQLIGSRSVAAPAPASPQSTGSMWLQCTPIPRKRAKRKDLMQQL